MANEDSSCTVVSSGTLAAVVVGDNGMLTRGVEVLSESDVFSARHLVLLLRAIVAGGI